jgi:excisionase family DNA binding protein
MGNKNATPNHPSILGQLSRERAFRTPEWVAAFLSVPIQWVLDAAKSGALPSVDLGGLVRFDPDAIKAWRRTSAVAPPARQGEAEVRPSEAPSSGGIALKEIRSDLRRLKSATLQPGAVAMTVEQAAERLGCSRRRVFELLAAGKLKRAAKLGRRAMVTVASVDRALQPSTKAVRPRTPSPAGFEVEDIPL